MRDDPVPPGAAAAGVAELTIALHRVFTSPQAKRARQRVASAPEHSTGERTDGAREPRAGPNGSWVTTGDGDTGYAHPADLAPDEADVTYGHLDVS